MSAILTLASQVSPPNSSLACQVGKDPAFMGSSIARLAILHQVHAIPGTLAGGPRVTLGGCQRCETGSFSATFRVCLAFYTVLAILRKGQS